MDWAKFCVSKIPDLINKYKTNTGREINLSSVRTFTDKIQWLKIYDSTYMKTFVADKVTVHKFYKQILGKDIGIPLIAVYNNPSQIEWDSLPPKIMIKCNHGSGYNISVTDKSQATIHRVSDLLGRWLQDDYSEFFCELHYKLIPRKILVEPYIDGLVDTKIFCFNGTPKFYQIDKHLTESRMNFYDLNGTPVRWLSNTTYPANYSILDPKPNKLNEMCSIATKLARQFKFVRVDFYTVGNTLYGGELTFTPGAGNQKYIGDGDRRLGDLLAL